MLSRQLGMELWLICRLTVSLGSAPSRLEGRCCLEQPCHTGPGDLGEKSPRATEQDLSNCEAPSGAVAGLPAGDCCTEFPYENWQQSLSFPSQNYEAVCSPVQSQNSVDQPGFIKQLQRPRLLADMSLLHQGHLSSHELSNSEPTVPPAAAASGCLWISDPIRAQEAHLFISWWFLSG